MKQWKCIQCGALFTTPTDAQPFPMTCNQCRAANPPSHAQFMRPGSPVSGQPTTGYGQAPMLPPAQPLPGRPPSPGLGQPAHRTASPRGGIPGPMTPPPGNFDPMNGPVPLPGPPPGPKVHTTSVTQMMKRGGTRTNLPTVPPPSAPTTTHTPSGRRRSTSVVGGFAHEAAEARGQAQPARSSKAGNRAVVLMFFGAVIAVIGIGVAIFIGIENPQGPKTTTGGENAGGGNTPTTTTAPGTGGKPTTPGAATGGTPTGATGTAGTTTPGGGGTSTTGVPVPAAPPKQLSPYEEMMQNRGNPPVAPQPTPAPGPTAPAPVGDTQRGKLLIRLDADPANKAGGTWGRMTVADRGGVSAQTWDSKSSRTLFPYYEWPTGQNVGQRVYVKISYMASGMAQPNVVVNLYRVGMDMTRLYLPAPASTQGRWLTFEQAVDLNAQLKQIEIRSSGDAGPDDAFAIQFIEVYAAEPVGAPTPAPVPLPGPAPMPPGGVTAANAERGELAVRLDAAIDNEGGGTWKRVRFETLGQDTVCVWDATTGKTQYPFFEWSPNLDAGLVAFVRVRYRTTGITKNVLTMNLMEAGKHAASVELPCALSQQNQWLEFESKVEFQDKLRQIELRPKSGEPGQPTITVDWIEVYKAKAPAEAAGGPTGAVGPVGPVTADQVAEFMKLVQANDLKGLGALVAANGGYLTCKDANGYTPLHIAARRGKIEVIGWLVKMGTPVNIRHKFQRTPLEQAAEWGELEALKTLLDLGADINAVDDENQPALYWAVTKGHTDVVQELTRRGANPNFAATITGNTVLHAAAKLGVGPIIQALLAAGADPQVKNKAGQTAAEVAQANNQPTAVTLLSATAGGATAPAPAADPTTSFLVLHGSKADTGGSKTWQNGTLNTEEDTTFASWSRTALKGQGNLQFRDGKNDMARIPGQIKIKARVRVWKASQALQVQVYTHQGEDNEGLYGLCEMKITTADGQWAVVEGTINGPSSPLRTVEFKIDTNNPVVGARIDVDHVEISLP